MISKELIAAIVATGLPFVTVSGIMMLVSQHRCVNAKFWSHVGFTGNILIIIGFVFGFTTYQAHSDAKAFFLWVANYLVLMGFTIVAALLVNRYVAKRNGPKLLFKGSVINTHAFNQMTFTPRKGGLYDIQLSQDSGSALLDKDLIIETTISVYRKKA